MDTNDFGDYAFFRLGPLLRHESPARKLSVMLEEKHVGKDEVIPEVVVQTECWFHPQTVSFVLNFNIHGAMSLETTARICLWLRNERLIFEGTRSPIKLDKLAAEKLDEEFQGHDTEKSTLSTKARCISVLSQHFSCQPEPSYGHSRCRGGRKLWQDKNLNQI